MLSDDEKVNQELINFLMNLKARELVKWMKDRKNKPVEEPVVQPEVQPVVQPEVQPVEEPEEPLLINRFSCHH